MQFCNTCQNLMYPASRNGELTYFCKHCTQSVVVDRPLVWNHAFHSDENLDLLMPNKTIILDPTLPRDPNLMCKKCGRPEPVYFQPSEENMALIYACRNQDCIEMGTLDKFDKIDSHNAMYD